MMRSLPARRIASRLLAPAWAVALAMLLKGHAEAGDGFSAAVVAGAALLLHALVLGTGATRRLRAASRAPALCALGLGLILAVVFAPLLAGHPPLHHVPEPGSKPPALGVLELHSGFVLDVGVFLGVLGFILGATDGLLGARERRTRREDAA